MSHCAPNRPVHRPDEHATVAELLEIRDAERSRGLVAVESTHALTPDLDDCPECAEELERLHQVRAGLRALPEQRAPAGLWDELEQDLRRRAKQRHARRRQATVLLAAAAVVLALLVPAGVDRVQSSVERRANEAQVRDQLVDLQERSALLEAELRALREQPQVLSGRQASAIVVVEDALAELDRRLKRRDDPRPQTIRTANSATSDSLSASRGDLGLWTDRVELQMTLMGLHLDPVTLYEL